MKYAVRRAGIAVLGLAFLMSASAAHATIGMLKQARTAGVKVDSCLDCHAAPHSKEVMEKRAHEIGYLITNCQGCHGGKFPARLSPAGDWLVEQKKLRGAKEVDGAWLKDYVPARSPQSAKK